MDIQKLLGQFLGQQSAQSVIGTGGQMLNEAKSALPADISQRIPDSAKGFGGGLATGSLLGLFLGNKKLRKKIGKMGGGVVGYGGAAALGALAHSAYQTYQANAQQQAGVEVPKPQPALAAPTPNGFWATQEAGGDPVRFELMVVKAMIAAANADGHIDAGERDRIFDAIGKVPLESDEKALLLDTLATPPTVDTIAAAANDLEQASALYVASRVAIDPDEPSEKAHLDRLAAAMDMPLDLVTALETEIAKANDTV